MSPGVRAGSSRRRRAMCRAPGGNAVAEINCKINRRNQLQKSTARRRQRFEAAGEDDAAGRESPSDLRYGRFGLAAVPAAIPARPGAPDPPPKKRLATKEDSARRRRKGEREDTTPTATLALNATAHFGPRPPAVTPDARGVFTHGGPSWLRNRHVSATATQHPAEAPRSAPPRRGALPSDSPIIYVVPHRYTKLITAGIPEATRS